MRLTNNARNGAIISLAIVIFALILLLIVNIVPNTNKNTLGTANGLMDYVKEKDEEIPIWKIVCYIIAGMLLVLDLIVRIVMCRCHNCGRRISYMNIFMMYCPYCSKSLEIQKEKE